MRVSEIMTAGVQTVRPGTPAANARERMRTKQIHHLVRARAHRGRGAPRRRLAQGSAGVADVC